MSIKYIQCCSFLTSLGASTSNSYVVVSIFTLAYALAIGEVVITKPNKIEQHQHVAMLMPRVTTYMVTIGMPSMLLTDMPPMVLIVTSICHVSRYLWYKHLICLMDQGSVVPCVNISMVPTPHMPCVTTHDSFPHMAWFNSVSGIILWF